MNIVFVEPSFPNNQRRFVLALAAVGANVIGIGESEEWAFDEELRDGDVRLLQGQQLSRACTR
jgi:hypothetical protein